MRTIGFIGCGNMGSAIARAVCKSCVPQSVLLANRTPEKAAKLAQELSCRTGTNAQAAACDWVFLGVKPQMMEAMLAEIAPVLAAKSSRTILVSMAAGLTMERIREMSGGSYPVVRIMPNTPCAIGAGVIQYCTLDLTEAEESTLTAMLQPAGLVDKLAENLIDAASSVSGCGPAFLYPIIEALADGGVAVGLPRDKAMAYAAQMVAGSARMVLESGQHPGALKDAVCSPGGSTIQGVRVLEQHSVRGAFIDAVQATFDKNVDMGKM